MSNTDGLYNHKYEKVREQLVRTVCYHSSISTRRFTFDKNSHFKHTKEGEGEEGGGEESSDILQKFFLNIAPRARDEKSRQV